MLAFFRTPVGIILLTCAIMLIIVQLMFLRAWMDSAASLIIYGLGVATGIRIAMIVPGRK